MVDADGEDADPDGNAESNCPFCAIVAGTEPASVLYRDGTSVAFLDVRPVNPGHALVVPRQHAAGLAGVDEATGGHCFGVAMRVAGALRASGVPTDGVNVLVADGAAAGQEVFHLHLHVVPRVEGDALSLDADRGDPSRAELDDLAATVGDRL